jgi:hypothetical protein
MQAVVLNNYDFTFATCAADVGMKTGATIHTMNGLNMNLKRVARDEPPPATDGWWEKQHLKRGLNANGMPYQTPEDAVRQKRGENRDEKNDGAMDPGTGCPM